MQQMILTTDVDGIFGKHAPHNRLFVRQSKLFTQGTTWYDDCSIASSNIRTSACSVLQTPFKCCWERYTTNRIECMHLLPTSLSNGSQHAATVWRTTDCITTGIGLHADFTAGCGASFVGHPDSCRGAHWSENYTPHTVVQLCSSILWPPCAHNVRNPTLQIRRIGNRSAVALWSPMCEITADAPVSDVRHQYRSDTNFGKIAKFRNSPCKTAGQTPCPMLVKSVWFMRIFMRLVNRSCWHLVRFDW